MEWGLADVAEVIHDFIKKLKVTFCHILRRSNMKPYILTKVCMASVFELWRCSATTPLAHVSQPCFVSIILWLSASFSILSFDKAADISFLRIFLLFTDKKNTILIQN